MVIKRSSAARRLDRESFATISFKTCMAGRCIHSNEYQPRARIHCLVFSKPTNYLICYYPNYKNRPSNILLAVIVIGDCLAGRTK